MKTKTSESRREELNETLTVLSMDLNRIVTDIKNAVADSQLVPGLDFQAAVDRKAAAERKRDELLREHGRVWADFQAALKEWSELK